MAGNWIKTALGDVLTLQRGFDLPAQNRRSGTVPVVASTGIVGRHDKAPVKSPGVVIGRSGSIGGAQFITDDFWPLNTTLWVKDFKGNYPRFVYYLLCSIDFKGFNVGSGVPTLNRNHIHSLAVSIPSSYSEQKAIAHILGTLDDKIELNQQMNRNLEAIASAIFKSWFVDFDPVRAKLEGRQPVGMDAATTALFPDSFEDSSLGEIPKGWMLGSLANLCVVQGGFAYKSKDFMQEGGYPVIKIKNIREDGTVDIDDIQYIPNQIAHKTSDYWLKNGELVMAMTGATVGKFALILNRQLLSLLNQRVARISPLKKYGGFVWFVYCALLETDLVDQIISIADGSAQPNISASGIESARLVIPPDSLIKSFNQKANALFDKIISNRVESRTLIATRDTLLPKLMSGEIRVKEAEKILEDVA
ncbi:restriction endonuclease subunit S [Chroococcidiopsis sp. CCALA 051]|uniref:restriction endonuclease subunit S n=1 Tax=Chroococcidiopsis sp. CCALA 051 TaxID=869949 RepID=UPI000D0CC19E|nr:restriction endonuclease subunit S [Chroococcidiopsis sp. CCALA 051]PSM48954.1 restriction endonuclease subunit S [Chroococcidiopsis sp. CCALA 051]